ncbi:MAG: imidazole glycerol phosphate synthase subunit HisF [Chitinophagales bacterium]|nr:imidazole glycerol phosphate synthase subunit HisF [Chitinophagales bacterium]
MLTKRIIPCLDIKDGQTVKGVNFVDLIHAGDPVELAQAYVEQGADELVFLDITATVEKRKTLVELVKKVAAAINIPFTVGGGISHIDDVDALLNAGADKISINSSAVKNPDLIDAMAKQFGSQFVVIAIDTKFTNDEWIVYTHGGRTPTTIQTKNWAAEVQNRGAGEILLTSMNHDGTKQGFALDITKYLAENLHIPVIASGGAGKEQHFLEVFNEANADAALAASIFHFGEIPIPQLKNYLQQNGVVVRV